MNEVFWLKFQFEQLVQLAEVEVYVGARDSENYGKFIGCETPLVSQEVANSEVGWDF